MLIQRQLAAERKKREELAAGVERQQVRDPWEAEDVGYDANGSPTMEFPA